MTPSSKSKPVPLGAVWDGEGTLFSLFSHNAHAVELSLFDAARASQPSQTVPLKRGDNDIWRVRLDGVRPGQLYGYRVSGPFEPAAGHRFSPDKLLLDPYAKAAAGTVRENGTAPLALVIDPSFDWGNDRRPGTPWHKTLIYELHVKGMTMLHPDIPHSLRGSYAALASKPVIDHLKSLGVTAIELLPVHQHAPERHLIDKKLPNYWGYSTLAYFAPDIRYSSSGAEGAVNEFKAMVKGFHAAGIEVILDVVYNHSAEGDHLGPTLSFRGIDNSVYYRQLSGDKSRYQDFTGCGNTLNTEHPRVLELILDSLRYWITDMRVDGFRFDLASALARGHTAFDKSGGFLTAVKNDPVISRVKLIAEPWDAAEGGYQLGNFPAPWSEWNGKYRDAVRRYWKGDSGTLGELATRLAGSSDLFEHAGRKPQAGISYITTHDGFSLEDLVSYKNKHNQANQEGGRDGENHNHSWNCGAEGATRDLKIQGLRQRQKRNLLATLLLSQGVVMLRQGDELGHSQKGNNNAYCQDNELSWLRWDIDAGKKRFLEFARALIRLRLENSAWQRQTFFHGREIHPSGAKDIHWLNHAGREMNSGDWNSPENHALGMLILEDRPGETSFLVLMNAGPKAVDFALPRLKTGLNWELLFDTAHDEARQPEVLERLHFKLEDRSLAILCRAGSQRH